MSKSLFSRVVNVISRAAATALLLAGMAAGALAQEASRSVEITQDADYFGFDLRAERDVSLEECQQLCIDDPQCKAFTFNTRVNWCFLKSDFRELGSFEGAIAGKIVEVASEPDIGAAPKATFVPAGLMDEADAAKRRAAAGSRKAEGVNTADEMELAAQAFSQNQSAAANAAYERATAAAPEDAALWLAFSRMATGWLNGNNGYDYNIYRMATAGAINAYSLTRTASARAEALDVLAQALEARSYYRPALEAYKASLELVDAPEVAAAYRKLREEKGFRVAEQRIEADNEAPRACVVFSEDLVKSGVDYGAFVTLDGRSGGAVEASGKTICVDGLEHGGTYRLSLRAGLPSSVGESLESPVTLNLYVRDRAPAVRFTGENFVLPDAARRGIPIVGINADSAKLELYRIGERSLSRLLSDSQFLTQLEGYTLDTIASDLGEPVWKGSVDLQREKNRDVVTSIPVGEILPARQPGIYVMTAQVEGERQDSWEQRATQWFLVSDLGLSAYDGADGLSVVARSLDSANALAGVELQLVARNNEVLGKALTDAKGVARFEPGLMRGEAGRSPVALMAGLGGDFAFLDLQRAGFDLSDRGVEGRAAPGPLDIFPYLDRGIYRPGETVHAMALARDDSANAVDGLPLTFVLRRPDGVEAARIVSSEPKLGGHSVSLALQENAMRGVWQMEILSDPAAAPVADKQFLVEDFRPDRIEFDLATDAAEIGPGKPATVNVDGRYLYGAPADGLELSGEIRLAAVRGRAQAQGFLFGLADEEIGGETVLPLADAGFTDDSGKASIDAVVAALPASTRPLEATIVVRMQEDGGRAVERTVTLPVAAQDDSIGVRPMFEDGQVRENTTAAFQVIALDAQGERIDLSGLKWTLYDIRRQYQWYRNGSYWNYEPVEIPTAIANGVIDAKAGEFASVSAPVGWGRYRLEVETADGAGPATSVEFEAGWYVEAASTETPDALEIALDREDYVAGEVAKLKVSPREAGRLLIAIGGDRLHQTIEADMPAEGAEIDIPVKAEWGAGAYVTATLYRPGSARESRLPARAIGTAWLQVRPGERKLEVSLDLPEKIRPGGIVTVPVSVSGVKEGEEAWVTVAAVDVGILNLTRYAPPEPSGWYFGQRALGLEIRDLYGRLIDGSLGVAGRLRTGGDGPGMASEGSPPTEKLMALFSGPVRLDAQGKAEITFEIPAFNGTARFMAVAWTRDGVGEGNGDLIIRDPLVLSASLPKVLAPGDEARALIEIANTDGEAGAYEIAIEGADLVSVGSVPPSVELAQGARETLDLPIIAKNSGVGEMVFSIRRGGEEMARVSQIVRVRPPVQPQSVKREIPLAANGGSVTIDGEMLADSHADTASVTVSVSKAAAFDVPALLGRLDRYPYGCAEQTTSRAMPLLYLSDLDAPKELLETPDIAGRIDGAIARVLSYQSSSGSFGLWGPGDGDMWLNAYVTDFLTRAREKGHAVPDSALRLAVNNLQNELAYNDDIASQGNEIAYSLYVLARNRMASASDLRYYADTKLGEFPSPLARAQLGAALSLYNEHERAARAFNSALEYARDPLSRDFARSDYGSALRDGAAILALVSETTPVPAIQPDLIELVAQELEGSRYTSTQEDAWLLLAARAVQEGNARIRLEVDGAAHEGALSVSRDGKDLTGRPLVVRNSGSEPLTAVVTTLAAPLQAPAAGGEGFEITRTYYTLDGEEANLGDVHQNDRFVVVLEINQFNDWASQVLVSDLLPGGFEIDNPRLVASADLEAFDWLGEVEAAHSEFRDDRFVAAFDRDSGGSGSYTVAYVVRAVTPGRYAHPAANVEDMYRPQLNARTAAGFLEVKARR
jgi:uncharacterized protein YfaS (alpha-2-macroglobulin family)